MGLDLPLWKQYLGWLGLLLRGNLGTSYQGVSVSDILVAVLPLTLFLLGPGTLAGGA
jgi:ABC-type dipeptide/oligopeptide/nickel transport system permease component